RHALFLLARRRLYGLRRRGASDQLPASSVRPSVGGDALFGLPGLIRRLGEETGLEAVLAVRTRLFTGLHSVHERIELVPVGGFIALEEEVQNLVADEAVGASDLDRRFPHVGRVNHAVGAMDLNALVVAIGRATRIGDLGDLARLRLHNDDRGVDIASLADRLVDE